MLQMCTPTSYVRWGHPPVSGLLECGEGRLRFTDPSGSTVVEIPVSAIRDVRVPWWRSWTALCFTAEGTKYVFNFSNVADLANLDKEASQRLAASGPEPNVETALELARSMSVVFRYFVSAPRAVKTAYAWKHALTATNA